MILVPHDTLGIFFNLDTKSGKNKYFRKAVRLVIRRNELTDEFSYLIPNNQVLPIGY